MSKKSGVDLNRLRDLLRPEIHEDYQRNDEKYFRFRRAAKIAEKFAETGQWSIKIDDPEVKTDAHFIRVVFNEDMYNDEDVQEFGTFIKLFDSFMIFSNNDQEVSISFMMDELYSD